MEQDHAQKLASGMVVAEKGEARCPLCERNASATITFMILLLVLTVVFGIVTVLTAHYLSINRLISSELARKSVHIAHALIIGSWPFFTNYKLVIIGELLSLLLVVLARVFKIFGPFREIQRLSWGEFFFPLAVIIMALYEPSPWLFLAAVLHFGFADALAAIVGDRIRQGNYVVLDHKKSFIGTSVFWLVSFGIVGWYINFHLSSATDLWPTAIIIPTVLAVAENVSPWGSDNLTIPLLAFVLLGAL